jgi:gluconolactonase
MVAANFNVLQDQLTMRTLVKICCLPALVFLASSAWTPVPALAQGTVLRAELETIAEGYRFTEGPTADDSGNVYFTDQPNDRIVFYDFATGETTTWMQPCGRSNGLFFVGPDKLIACADANNELWSIDTKSKQHKVLADGYQGRRFGGPNDCWVDRNGTVYFTDPLYKRPYWTQTFDDDHPRGVYRRDQDGQVVQVAGDLVQPNGIVGDASKRILYVADINARRTYRYRIDDDGSLVDKQLFCESGSDGMTLDENGNVYLTGKEGVTVFDSKGQQIKTIGIPRGWTANVTFAGPEKRHLFVTAGDAIFIFKTNARGI